MVIERFGRYRIKSMIGHGGMSMVYHAFDPTFGRDVAIKVLPRETLIYPQFRRRFEREAKAIAYLEHPAIVPVYDFGEENGQPYIVMRYMSGGSLSDRLRFGSLPVEDSVKIIARIAPAMDAAHSRGIIHRDIKPDNILFDQYGTVFLSDFGLAHLKESTGLISQSDLNIMGTPAYMSPEQVQGDRELDGRSDIYSLGVVFYQMLTGSMPYVGKTPASIMMMHLLNPVPKIRDRNIDLPSELERVIETAMAKDPKDRYRSTSEMAEAIEKVASSTRMPTPNPFGIGSQATAAATMPLSKATFGQLTTVLSRESFERLRKSVPRWVWVVSLFFVISMVAALTLSSRILFPNLLSRETSSPTATYRILISNTELTSPTPFLPQQGFAVDGSPSSQPSATPESSVQTESKELTATATLPPPTDTSTPLLLPTRSIPTATQLQPSPTRETLPIILPTPTEEGPLPTPTEPSSEPTLEPPTPTIPP